MRLDSGLSLKMGSWFARAVAAGSTLLDGLVSYWPLDEVSGTRADAVGDNDLTDNNTVGVKPSGPVGRVAKFALATDESLSKTSVTLPASYSVSTWVYVESSGNTYQGIISCVGASWANDSQIALQVVENPAGTFKIWNEPGNGSVETIAMSGEVSVGWHHIIATFNASNGAVIVYADGVAGSTATMTGTRAAGTDTLKFGELAGLDTTYNFNSKMGPTGLWSAVLGADERASLFNSGVAKTYADLTAAEKTNLVSYWDLSETSGNRADSHGSYTLTDNNTVTSEVSSGDVMHNAAASFASGNTEYLSLGSGISALSDNFSVQFWLKQTTTGRNSLLGNGAFPSLYVETSVFAAGDLIFWGNDAFSSEIKTAGSKLKTDGSGWDHVLITFDSSATPAGHIWINGVDEATTSGSPAALTVGSYFKLGDNADSQLYDGLMDEVAIWNRVLTEDERAELYASGAGVYYNGSDFV